MNLAYRVFHNRLWEIEFCKKYSLGIEYRIDHDSLLEEGRKNARFLENLDLPKAFHYPSWGDNIWLSHSIEENRKIAIEKFKGYLEICKLINAKVVVIHDEEPLGGIEPYIRSLREIVRISRRDGIKVAIENARTNPFFLLDLISGVEGVGLTLDLGHANIQLGGDGTLRFMEKAMERIIHLHVHDNHGIYDEHLVPGDGSLNYGEIMQKLKEINFDGMAVLELSWDIDPENGIRKSIEFLGNLL